MDNIIMMLFITFFACIICFRMHINKTEEFLTKKQTDILKGICSIIIIFVHIPNGYSNKIQDMVSSFGYICVSLFFMLSAYGLKYSIENKKDYLKGFLIKRLPSILIPFIIANIINIIINKGYNQESFKIFGFVYVLIVYYIAFYLIYKLCKNRKKADILMCIFCIMFSVLGKFTNSLIGWYTEQIGFIIGILLFDNYKLIKTFCEKNWLLKFFVLLILNLILGVLYIKLKHVFFFGDYILRIVLAISLITLILIIIRNFIFGNKILKIFAGIYYEIYLLQVSTIDILSKINVSSSTFIIILMIINVTIAYFMNKFDKYVLNKIEKIL